MLEKINNLEDFKKIDTKDYPKLASEIREFLIDNELYYDEDIHYCEDSIFGSKVMYNANRFYYLKSKYLKSPAK